MRQRVAAITALFVLLCSVDVCAQTTANPPSPAETGAAAPSDAQKAPAPAKKPAKPKPKQTKPSAAPKPAPATPGTTKAAPPASNQPASTVTEQSAPAAQQGVSGPAKTDAPGVARLVPPGEDRDVIPLGQPVAVPVASPATAQAAAGVSDTPPAPSSAGASAKESDSAAAGAKEKAEIEVLRQTTLNLIRLLVESGILTQEKADALMREAKQSAAQATAAQTSAESKVVRVPYVPQFMRDQMKEELRQEVVAQAKEERWGQPGAVPEWVDRFTFFGDFRLRYQYNQLSPNNAAYFDVNATNIGAGPVLLNTTTSFDYLRYQLRLGTHIKISDQVIVGASLASGNEGNPVSLNQTLGTGFNKNSVVIDQAYLRYDPARWFTAWGGRVPNPFFSTDLVWYDQLNFDGLAATARAPLGSRSRGWVTLGAFPVDTIDCTDASQIHCGDNKWLYAVQGVFETKLAQQHKLTVGLAYYDWSNYQGKLNSPTVNPGDRTFVPRFAQKGNTMFNIVTNGGNPLLGVAAQFREVNLNGTLDLGYWDPVRTVLTGDIVKNVGYDQGQIFQQTGGLVDQPPRTLGWYVRLLVGAPSVAEAGDWQAWVGYKSVQRDSVVDGYNDPDFHFGGTDAKGYLLGLSYGIARNAFARLRWYSANAIDGPPLAWDVFQIDVGARF